MSTVTISSPKPARRTLAVPKAKRIESIDLLRGIVMIIMALDHVRDYFHADAFYYSPTDLSRTSPILFFTRWITHFCAPIFFLLAGISAHLYGASKGRKELAVFLLTRGLWLVFAELFIISLGWTFNPTYRIFNLQVIWATGISMIALAGIIHLKPRMILLLGIALVAGHNLLDGIHVPGGNHPSPMAILWSFLHEERNFVIGPFSVFMRYPVIPWIGILSLGYYIGILYTPAYNAANRTPTLILLGIGSISLFILLRAVNWYGDPSHWTVEKNFVFDLLSFLNTTKYPPSLLYILMTLGPALLFLALVEHHFDFGQWGQKIKQTISVFGRVPMFYYILHIFLVHSLAVLAAVASGHSWSDMVLLPNRVNRVSWLKGYGFGLGTVYLVWIAVILILYPFCKRFDKYKRAHQAQYWWLRYL